MTMSAKELAETAPDRAIKRTQRRVIKRLREIVEEGAVNATKYDDDGNAVPMSEREKHIAMDMRKSLRNRPGYIDTAQRVLEGHNRAEALKNQGNPVNLNIGTVNIVQAPEYPVIDVEAQEK